MKLKALIRLQLRYWPLGLVFTIAIIAAGLYSARSLNIDSNLKALLPQNSWVVKNMDIISPKAAAGSDLRLVLSGGSFQQKLEAAGALKAYLESIPGLVRSVRFKSPRAFIDKHKYQLIPMSSLKEIEQEVERRRKEHAEVTDPLGLEAVIEKEENAKAGITDETEKEEELNLQQAKDFLSSLEDMPVYFTTEDQKYLALRVVPTAESLNIANNRKTLKAFNESLAKFDLTKFHPDMKVATFGGIYNSVERYDSIIGDVSFGGWGLLLILVIVLVYFRSPWTTLILFPPLISGVVAGTGIATLIEGKFNIIAIFLILVVFGVGIEFGIHLWARMLQERKTKKFEEALLATWESTGRATITSTLALLAGFALLTFSSFQGFAQFGRVAVILLATTAGAFLLLMPSWICFVERLRNYKAWKPSLADTILERADQFRLPKNFSMGLRGLSLLVVLIALPAILLFFRFDYTYKETTKIRYNPIERQALAQIFGGKAIKPSAVAIFDTEKEAGQFIDKFNAEKKNYPDIRQMTGMFTFLPSDQEQRIAKLQEIADGLEPSWVKKIEDEQVRKALTEIQDTAYDLEPWTEQDVPLEIKEPFSASDGSGQSIAFIYDLGGDTDGRKSIRFSNALADFVSKSEIKPIYSGQELILADVVSRVTGEGPWLILGMFIFVFLICWIDFRNLKYATITILPVFFGFLLTGAILVLMDIDINFFNMVAIASLGAMVVDNSIHFFHRFLGSHHKSEADAIRKTSFAVSPTIFACTLTSICGYYGMLVANHSGIASLGFVAVLGLSCCLISSIVFFPAWLEVFDRKAENSENQQKKNVSAI